jgi:sulfite dehydrogenase
VSTRRCLTGAHAAPALLKSVVTAALSARLTPLVVPVALALWAAAASAQGPAVAQDEALAQGRRLFTTDVQPSCTVCHALKDAGSTAEIGPPLDDLKPDAGRVARALRNGIGVMPSFREKLSEAQIEALARYVAHATGAGR